MNHLIGSSLLFAVAFWLLLNSILCLMALLSGQISGRQNMFYYERKWSRVMDAFFGVFFYGMWSVSIGLLAKRLADVDLVLAVVTGLSVFVAVKIVCHRFWN